MDRGHDRRSTRRDKVRVEGDLYHPIHREEALQQKRISTFPNAFMGFKSSDFQNILGGEMTKKMFMTFLPNALDWQQQIFFKTQNLSLFFTS